MSVQEKTNVIQIDLEEILQHFRLYLQRVESGETVVILEADKPIAEIRPPTVPRRLRPFGLCAGEFRLPNDFDAPLPEHIIQEFENG
ncbi:MAG: type II toxin-antitoxin system Phd/YefM family antitoxin [Anaerolineae bacterium]